MGKREKYDGLTHLGVNQADAAWNTWLVIDNHPAGIHDSQFLITKSEQGLESLIRHCNKLK